MNACKMRRVTYNSHGEPCGGAEADRVVAVNPVPQLTTAVSTHLMRCNHCTVTRLVAGVGVVLAQTHKHAYCYATVPQYGGDIKR